MSSDVQPARAAFAPETRVPAAAPREGETLTVQGRGAGIALEAMVGTLSITTREAAPGPVLSAAISTGDGAPLTLTLD